MVFAIGDRVRATKQLNMAGGPEKPEIIPAGTLGTVINVVYSRAWPGHLLGKTPYDVQFDLDMDYAIVSPDEIEKVPDE
jgi:hypothetical protein